MADFEPKFLSCIVFEESCAVTFPSDCLFFSPGDDKTERRNITQLNTYCKL